jgi:hypothetical protein
VPAVCRSSCVGKWSTAEQYRRKSVVEDWVAQHGWTCPGYERKPHESHDPTADHIRPVGRGGAESGPLQVRVGVAIQLEALEQVLKTVSTTGGGMPSRRGSPGHASPESREKTSEKTEGAAFANTEAPALG